jgi:hypothetical protein
MGITPSKSKNTYNLFQRVTINSSSFSATSDITVPFKSSNSNWKFQFEGSGTIEYSFDGVNVHGDMDSTQASKSLDFLNRHVSAVWFRLKSASGGVVVRVEAWAV